MKAHQQVEEGRLRRGHAAQRQRSQVLTQSCACTLCSWGSQVRKMSVSFLVEQAGAYSWGSSERSFLTLLPAGKPGGRGRLTDGRCLGTGEPGGEPWVRLGSRNSTAFPRPAEQMEPECHCWGQSRVLSEKGNWVTPTGTLVAPMLGPRLCPWPLPRTKSSIHQPINEPSTVRDSHSGACRERWTELSGAWVPVSFTCPSDPCKSWETRRKALLEGTP